MDVIFCFCVAVIVLIVTRHIKVTYENTTRIYLDNDDYWCVVKLVVLFQSKAKRITFAVGGTSCHKIMSFSNDVI